MDVSLIKKEGHRVSLEISETNHITLNTLRRLILEEVPTLAIEEVHFLKNSSALYDEMIALRLGLVPLKTDLDSYVFPEQGKRENDPSTFVNFKLKVPGPATVYAEDLKSQDPKIVAVYPKLVITKLLKNQQLELEAKAILGNGLQHMKFSPGLAYYHHKYKVAVKQKDPGSFRNKYPPQIFDGSGKIDAKLINTVPLIDACKYVNSEIVDVKEEKDTFEFHFESWGQLEIKEVFSKAIKIFQEKLDTFEKELKKIK